MQVRSERVLTYSLATSRSPPPPKKNLQDDYGVPEDQIFGIRFGLRGFLDRHAKPVQLSRSKVDGIQLKGGTVLVRGGLLLWEGGGSVVAFFSFQSGGKGG